MWKHDDVIKWKHFPRYWPFVRGIHRSPVKSPLKGQWRGALMFTLICARINGWVNNREAGDLRRYRAHYDVTVMRKWCVQRPILNVAYHLGNCFWYYYLWFFFLENRAFHKGNDARTRTVHMCVEGVWEERKWKWYYLFYLVFIWSMYSAIDICKMLQNLLLLCVSVFCSFSLSRSVLLLYICMISEIIYSMEASVQCTQVVMRAPRLSHALAPRENWRHMCLTVMTCLMETLIKLWQTIANTVMKFDRWHIGCLVSACLVSQTVELHIMIFWMMRKPLIANTLFHFE